MDHHDSLNVFLLSYSVSLKDNSVVINFSEARQKTNCQALSKNCHRSIVHLLTVIPTRNFQFDDVIFSRENLEIDFEFLLAARYIDESQRQTQGGI